MLKVVNKKVLAYISTFRDELSKKLNDFDMGNDDKRDLLSFIYDYEGLTFDRDDMVVRKRVKNVLPEDNRCCALRANGEQCTRRRKDEGEFCGTHSKGTPNGVVDNECRGRNTVSVSMRIVEIGGIVYHIDNKNCVYNTEDIMNGVSQPHVIGTYDVINNVVNRV